jgi:hypothetical protein
MDDELINRIVKLKLDTAEKLLDRMPEKMSSELRNMCREILKSVNENVPKTKEHPTENSKSSDHLNHVSIE